MIQKQLYHQVLIFYVVFIGQYCLLSLFIAIIISNYIRYYNEESKFY